ncbi:MAG: gas vesicle protein [Acidobacteria bacterium]|nr:gas vesicle protein [Acidobacteriota bacterium]
MPRRTSRSTADQVLETHDASLLDVVDNALTKGVVLSGDLTLGLAQVDLVYARLSLLLCAADRVLPTSRAPRTHPTARVPWGPGRRRRG